MGYYRYKNYELTVFDMDDDKPIVGADVFLYSIDFAKI